MKTVRSKLLYVALTSLLTVACSKTVTNYVPTANNSTLAPQTASPGNSAAESGGVINGGGGKGVRCNKDGKQTVEVLDLYEAKTIYDLTLLDFGTTEEPAKDKLAQILAKHFWNPYTIQMARYAEALKQTYIQEVINNIRFIDSGKRLKLTNDSYEPTLENGCESVQIAMYYDESVLLVDKSLWDQMDWTNKMGLLAHESLYFLARQNGTNNSMSTRKLVGMLFSTKGVRPVADGVPNSRDQFLDCRLSDGGFGKGHFYMYRGQSKSGRNGMELVFADLGNDGSLFRTSAFVEDLSFVQLQFPNFNGVRSAALVKDTYPTRDEISLSFAGIKDGYLRASLRILRGAGATVANSYEVSCDLPSDFDKFEPQSTEPGEFEQKHGSGDVDRLKIEATGRLTLEQARQVGGKGGISGVGVVPYPTVCRYKQYGVVSKRDSRRIQYTVISGELGSQEGLSNTAHCEDYIQAFNRQAADGSLSFTINMDEFTPVSGTRTAN